MTKERRYVCDIEGPKIGTGYTNLDSEKGFAFLSAFLKESAGLWTT